MYSGQSRAKKTERRQRGETLGTRTIRDEFSVSFLSAVSLVKQHGGRYGGRYGGRECVAVSPTQAKETIGEDKYEGCIAKE